MARNLDGSNIERGFFSGTWNADLPNFSGKTMEEMLKRTAEKQISGFLAKWSATRVIGGLMVQSLRVAVDDAKLSHFARRVPAMHVPDACA